MGKHEKPIKRIFEGKADITPDEAASILKKLNFKSTVSSGSHRTFRKPNRQVCNNYSYAKPIKTVFGGKITRNIKAGGIFKCLKKI